MVPETVSRRLYIYSLKMRDLLMEQIGWLERECLELRRQRDEWRWAAEQAGQQMAQLKQELDQARSQRQDPAHHQAHQGDERPATPPGLEVPPPSTALVCNEALTQAELEALAQFKAGRALLAWRNAVVQARGRHRQAEQAFVALAETNSIPVRALVHGQLQEAGDAVFEAIDTQIDEHHSGHLSAKKAKARD